MDARMKDFFVRVVFRTQMKTPNGNQAENVGTYIFYEQFETL